MTTLHGHSIIASVPLTKGSNSIRAISPLDGQPVEPAFSSADVNDVDAALSTAAQAAGPYAELPAARRADFLEAIASEIEALGDILPERARTETGLGIERLVGERARTCAQLRLFASVVREGSWVDARIDTALPDRKPLPRPDLRRMLVPIGPVVVFGSSNFPLAFSVAGGDTASALAAGNPVVVKAHRGHPGTSELVASAIVRAVKNTGMPNGVFSLLHGSGRVIGQALAVHPATRAVGFTGSHEAGRSLFDAAAARPDPIPVFAEMASLNPVVLLPGALQERSVAIASGLAASVTLGVGQFCTKPGLVFGLKSPEFSAFADTLAEAIAGCSPATMLHEGICRSFHDGVARMSAIPGVRLLAKSENAANPQATEGAPCVMITDAATLVRHRELIAEEIFGPFCLLVEAASREELTQALSLLRGQLTATLHALPEELDNDLVALLQSKAGRLVLNGFPTGVEVCHAMTHGGPYPATSDTRFTSVGTAAMERFVRPVTYQSFPDANLPAELQNANPRGILRMVNGEPSRDPLL